MDVRRKLRKFLMIYLMSFEVTAIGVASTPPCLPSTTVTLTVKLKELLLRDDAMPNLRSLLNHFERFGDLSDLENTISNWNKGAELAGDGQSVPFYNLADSQQNHFEVLGYLSNFENTILNERKAPDLMDDRHPGKAEGLMNLDISQRTRFEHLGDMSHHHYAIFNQQNAVDLTDDGHPDQAAYFLSLGNSQHTRFQRLGDLSDLQNAISNQQKAVELADDGHPGKTVGLLNLGISQRTRFEHLGDSFDLDCAIFNQQKAVDLIDDGHPNQDIYFFNLGISQQIRSWHLDDLPDLNHAISNKQKAVNLTYNGHPDQAVYFSSLANSQKTRFEGLGYLSDLEKAISNQQKAVDLTDDGHPNQSIYFNNLGNSQQTRFERLGDLSDLENAISNKRNAVELTDDGHPDRPIYLSSLGNSQKTRFQHLGDLSDLENAISNQQRAVELTDNGYHAKSTYLSNLGISQKTRFESLGDLSDLENAISNHQNAVDLTDTGHPDQPTYYFNLSICQQTRFERLGVMFDLENAISNMQILVESVQIGHPSRPRYLSNLGNSQRTRFERLGYLPDLKTAIFNQQRAVRFTDDGHPAQPVYLSNLGISQQVRFKRLRHLSDLENAISNQQKAVDLTDVRHPAQPIYLSNLGNCQQTRFECLGDLSDLENAISNKQKAVDLTNDRHPWKGMRLSILGISQETRFQRLGELSDLENAISNQQLGIASTDDGHPVKASFLLSLGTSLQSRFLHFGDPDDFATSVLSYKAAAHLKSAYPSVALHAARQWAQTSHQNGDLHSALDGYRTALELFSKVAWLGLDTPSRQDRLLQEKAENLGCLAATCAIGLGHLEEAVELLDLGRSVFWQQASSLRSDFEMLREEDAELAERFKEIGQQLDAGNFDSSYFITEDKLRYNQFDGEEIGRERRRLVGEWEELVVRVRQLPRFKSFLKPIPFSQLRQSSTTGQVIIINTSTYGVDALIFGATGPIEHVSLPHINHDMLTELSENIVLKQPSSGSEMLRRTYTTRFLKPALRTIWNDILIHIFDKIHNISLQHNVTMMPRHRIWWYLTGPIAFIPVHAAGPGRGAPDVSQLIISSYVTTLESLFRAQKKYTTLPIECQKFLCVSQPETPGQTPLPQTTTEVDNVVQILCSLGWPKEHIARLSGTEATVDAVSAALNCCLWLHLACHGFQHTGLGMKSSFALHNGHLELGEIASKRVSKGQFALLSACQAASGQSDLPGEAMHLAAGFQFAGFPSVIATLWTIRDDNAPKVTAQVYGFLLRNGTEGLDPSDAASALNHAILHLRKDTSVTVDRWAPFVHFGI
ncbi:hypothetical protein PILCRDRAFT_227158 [Piloderma croceum F 1598]|uniref:CHAT domain-containing protein n=1 Tax=Piloderma croceum (strain F 1598) TaxID=765440 RepID=A0A0C3GCS3_PILCF|nr:hypothetical protein PILCRDRAFT_227158 [Piloderma croceum F 1598]